LVAHVHFLCLSIIILNKHEIIKSSFDNFSKKIEFFVIFPQKSVEISQKLLFFTIFDIPV